ncbi:MAG: DALR domain-containing protein, partial [Ginsengibacter sp.]
IECSAMATKYLGSYFDIHGGGMDLMFPHHESEIAQSTICNNHTPAKYWMHNNMITINGKKMGKSYNNVIKLTELFSGDHPLLTQAFSPMTVRFFILQTHYRSTLDFSSEALEASEKGLRRLWDAFELLKKINVSTAQEATDIELDKKINRLISELDVFLNDDFNTAKVLANLFEIVPIINSMNDGHINPEAISAATHTLMAETFSLYLVEILGLKNEREMDAQFTGVMDLLTEIRKDAKSNKDFFTSDKIRNQLSALGIEMKDEKDGKISWNIK